MVDLAHSTNQLTDLWTRSIEFKNTISTSVSMCICFNVCLTSSSSLCFRACEIASICTSKLGIEIMQAALSSGSMKSHSNCSVVSESSVYTIRAVICYLLDEKTEF